MKNDNREGDVVTFITKSAGLLAIATLIFVHSPSWGKEKVRLSIATGGIGGVYYPIGRAMATTLTTHLPHVEATAESTTASVDNCLLVSLKKADLAFVMADCAWDARQGVGSFKERIPLQVLAVLYPNSMHIIASGSKGIDRVTDLKGKRVSTGAERSGTEVIAERLLETYGMVPDRDSFERG
jgi:uncharacterized protein